MKSRRDGGKSETGRRPGNRAQSTPFKKRPHKHTVRLGGGGLSLEAFAAAKSKPFISPAQIRDHREVYTNAKKVQKYKKLVKRLGGNDRGLKDEEAVDLPGEVQETNDKSAPASKSAVGFGSRKRPLLNTDGKQYKHRRQQLQQPKSNSHMEIARDKFQKKELDEKATDGEELHGEQQQPRETVQHDGKVTHVRQERLRKKTQRGQPVMKHQMERLLEAIQRSS